MSQAALVERSKQYFIYLCGYHLAHMALRFYMSCFQLNVGGSGTATPSTVNIPGAYAATDPGILIGELKELIKLIKI